MAPLEWALGSKDKAACLLWLFKNLFYEKNIFVLYISVNAENRSVLCYSDTLGMDLVEIYSLLNRPRTFIYDTSFQPKLKRVNIKNFRKADLSEKVHLQIIRKINNYLCKLLIKLISDICVVEKIG